MSGTGDDDDTPNLRDSRSALARLDFLMSGPPAAITELNEADIEEVEVPSAESLARAELESLVFQWAALIDTADYFEILQLARPTSSHALPGADEVRASFRAFAVAFHPDRFVDASGEVRLSATKVFGRGAEAYRVLLDPLLGKLYLRRLEAGQMRLLAHEVSQAARGDMIVESVASLVRRAAAIPFAEEADERIAAGELRAALHHIERALTFEPTNIRLQERRRDLEAQAVAEEA